MTDMTDVSVNCQVTPQREEKNKIVAGMLYLVATPIGNLSDLSERAIKVLSEVDFIAAEDTRNTLRLLRYLGIQKPLISYFEHNKRTHGQTICARLASGDSCALVTDAGTPAISDPGEDIVALCAQNNIPVTSIPGPCAAILSLTLSGLPTGRFCFEGFLPTDKTQRKNRLSRLALEDRTMIFHEAPHKLVATLSDLRDTFGGNRRISLCRELTKLNEEIMRITLDGAIEYYSTNSPRGEYVLVLEGCTDLPETQDISDLSIEEQVQMYIDSGMSKMEAIKKTAKERNIPKNDVYQKVAVKENRPH